MKTKLSIGMATLCVAIGASPALAGGQEPGIPGQPNCKGQTIAFLAQLGKLSGEQRARGLGQLAKFFTANGEPTTVQDLHQIAEDFCALS